MSGRILVQNTLGNSLIDLLDRDLVSAIGLGAIAFCGSRLELLDGGLQLGLRSLVARVANLTDQNTLFGRLNIRQTKHLLLAFLDAASDFSTVQNDILAENFQKSKPFFCFFYNFLHIADISAKANPVTTRFCVRRMRRLFAKRTDLALEARELWQESAGTATKLAGVKAVEKKVQGYSVTRIDILDRRGEAALGKPVGSYRTLDLSAFWQRSEGFFDRAVRAVGQQLRELIPESGAVLVAGLGNAAMTPDAVGPLAADSVLITRHLIAAMPRQFSGFRPVAVLRTGVLGATGVESAEAVRGLAAQIHPALIIAVDALASRRMGRLCNTIQFSDTGIIPGSGVGNHRAALNRETLGVPVIAVGVPTVVDAATLAADLLEESGLPDIRPERLQSSPGSLMVTPRDIDQQVRDLGKVIGYGINWALQDLEIEEINALLS